MLKVQKGHSSFSFLFKTACSFLFCFVFFFQLFVLENMLYCRRPNFFDSFLESAALATNGSLPKLHFDNHCNDITLTLQSHISPQGNHPLLVGPLLIEIRLKSAFWRKLQPLYCLSAFLKRETRISINNGPTNRGWSACDKPLSCLTLVQFPQSCTSTDFTHNKITKHAPRNKHSVTGFSLEHVKR